jgi:hypothetical protein
MKLPYPLAWFFACWLAIMPPTASAVSVPTEGSTVQLPDIKTTAPLGAADFKFPAKGELVDAGFPSGSAQLNITYPGKAFTAGVPAGRATVAVLLDQEGQPVDYLVVRYTQPFFAEALLEEARTRKYAPKQLRNTAVPGTFHFSYEFESPNGLGNINGFDAVNRRMEVVSGGPKLIYEPHNEMEIDGGQLQPIHIEVPAFPAGFPVPAGKTVRLLASFYVDETGHARLPNVESSLPPSLVPRAVEALRHWTFQPPTLHGVPVLVRTMRAVTFRLDEATQK